MGKQMKAQTKADQPEGTKEDDDRLTTDSQTLRAASILESPQRQLQHQI